MTTTMRDAVKTMKSALGSLYTVLSDEQRKVADQLIHGPMGMGHMQHAPGSQTPSATFKVYIAAQA